MGAAGCAGAGAVRRRGLDCAGGWTGSYLVKTHPSCSRQCVRTLSDAVNVPSAPQFGVFVYSFQPLQPNCPILPPFQAAEMPIQPFPRVLPPSPSRPVRLVQPQKKHDESDHWHKRRDQKAEVGGTADCGREASKSRTLQHRIGGSSEKGNHSVLYTLPLTGPI